MPEIETHDEDLKANIFVKSTNTLITTGISPNQEAFLTDRPKSSFTSKNASKNASKNTFKSHQPTAPIGTEPATKIFFGSIWNPVSQTQANPAEIQHISDGAIVTQGRKILFCGQAQKARKDYPDANVHDHHDKLILPGFVDTHTHMPQLDIIGSHSNSLLHWLDTYTFPKESEFTDKKICQDTSIRFLNQLLENGVSTSVIFSTSHEQNTDILFKNASLLGNRAIIGKVSMDRNAPEALLQNVADDHASIERLISQWHGHDERLFFALTPRFAPTSTPELLESMRDLKKKHPSVWLQTHFSESADEIAFVKSLFPKSQDYLDVYDSCGLLGEKTILAHCIHPSASELERLKESKSSISHCPTSNLFLGSGLMPLHAYLENGQKVSLGSDVGGGTSLSPWQTMNEAYKTQSLLKTPVEPSTLFYLSTLGGAETLGLGETVGSLQAGKDADFQILDLSQQSSLNRRIKQGTSPDCLLLPMMMCADSRIVSEVYVAGRHVYSASDSLS